jgi:putative addiction module killer protein
MLEIKTFSRNGHSPFWDWLNGLDDLQARARVRTRLDRLKLGNWGDFRALDGGVFELKIDYGPGYRVYFGKIGNTLVLLLCGGDKKTQRTDIRLAKQYFKEFNDAQKQRHH